MIRGASFVVASNGFGDGPARPLREHLLHGGAELVVEISHPLVPEGPTGHRIIEHRADGTSTARSINPRLHPPISFALDPLIPLRVPPTSGWFGFNCLATARGLVERRLGRTGRVVHWNVDFVPERFGPGRLSRVYERIDAQCWRRADAHVDLSNAALEARTAAYGMEPGEAAPSFVVPMGSWLGRTPTVSDDAASSGRIVFLGHLVPRMGVVTLLDAVQLLRTAGLDVTLEVIGGGPLLDEVRTRADAIGSGVVTVHGFVEDHRDVEAILARGTVAAAPYAEDPASFTRWADPGKLKAYLGAGLPVVMTSTPPNAAELEASGAALVVSDSAESVADGLRAVLTDSDLWRRMHHAAMAEAQRYDWPVVLDRALEQVGFSI